MHNDAAPSGHRYPSSRWPSRKPRPSLRDRKPNSSQSFPAWSSAISESTAWNRPALPIRWWTLTN